MAVKTLTITDDAYEALRALRESNESFSETILRVAKRKPLSYFYGSISKENGKKLEKTILKVRKIRNEIHKKDMKNK